ncbi:acyl-CoA thioesterase [Solimicrobium silvestre]|uniref:acyl-CoA thioesterase n=1 Tax=Solimicrobium silvestre TaxID=2099400 RepID=UPI000CFAD2DA|nr:acyl-CoA thioesterase [Solimicrobium silvestre]
MKLVYTCCMPVRWGDMDAFGHVNNTVYFRYMEQARIEWMASFLDVASASNTGPVLINAQCNFLRSLKYPDQIEVQMFIAAPGRSSFNTHYQIYRLGAEKTRCAEGQAKVVWVDTVQEKSAPLPEAVLAQFR